MSQATRRLDDVVQGRPDPHGLRRGVDFAYRELGPKTGVPVVFLTHLAAVLDNWDPRVVDGIAAKHRVITFDNRGVGASSGSTPTTIEAMAKDAVTFIRALGLEQVDLLGFSMGGMIAQVIAADEPQLVRKLILAGTGPAGGEGIDNVTRISHLDTAPRAAHLAGPEAVPLLHQDRPNGRRAGKEFLARLKERTETATRRSRCGPTAPSSRPSTAGACSSPPTCPSSISRCSSPTARATGWCPRRTRSTWLGACRTRAGDLPRRRPRRHLPVPPAVRQADPRVPRALPAPPLTPRADRPLRPSWLFMGSRRSRSTVFLGEHHPVALTVHDEHRLVNARPGSPGSC